MAKAVANAVLDAALNYIKNNAALMTVCNAQPTTYEEATATFKLADVAIDSTDFGSPADGDVSGRKIQVNAQTGITVDTSGTANHVAIVDEAALLYVTTCTSQGVVATSTIDTPAWEIEILDPS